MDEPLQWSLCMTEQLWHAVEGYKLYVHCTYLRTFVMQSRRAAIGMLAGVAAVAAGAAPSQAAYGDSANIFGKITNKSGTAKIHTCT